MRWRQEFPELARKEPSQPLSGCRIVSGSTIAGSLTVLSAVQGINETAPVSAHRLVGPQNCCYYLTFFPPAPAAPRAPSSDWSLPPSHPVWNVISIGMFFRKTWCSTSRTADSFVPGGPPHRLPFSNANWSVRLAPGRSPLHRSEAPSPEPSPLSARRRRLGRAAEAPSRLAEPGVWRSWSAPGRSRER